MNKFDLYPPWSRRLHLWMAEGRVPRIGGGTEEGGDPPENPEEPSGGGKTYTKAELDAIVAKSVAKAQKPFADYADLRAKADQLAELQAQSQTAEERMRTAHDRAVRERDAAVQRATEQAIRSAIQAEAQKQGAVDPAAVSALLDRTELSIEGERVEGVEEAVRALLAAKPYLLESGSGTRRRAGSDGSNANLSESGSTRVTQAQHREWLRTGQMTPDKVKLVNDAIRNGTYVAGR